MLDIGISSAKKTMWVVKKTIPNIRRVQCVTIVSASLNNASFQ